MHYGILLETKEEALKIARIAFPLCVLLLSACASPAPNAMARAGTALGLNDGMADAQGEAARYETSCGADFNRAQYQEGFQDGLARRPKPPAAR